MGGSRIRKSTAVIILIIACVCFLVLVYFKVIKLNHPGGIKGADISAYQGDIEWDVLSKKLDFVYIKATEGSSFTDEKFEYNWKNSRTTDLTVGAYHFFSYDSSGEAQAQHFIKTVGITEGMLPPAIDVEFYGDYIKNPKSADEVKNDLKDMISALETYYGTKPVIYCTSKAYRLYGDIFGDCPLWIRNVYFMPIGRDWTFWQYSDTGELSGYSGEEKYIDLDVFEGSSSDFDKLKIKTVQ